MSLTLQNEYGKGIGPDDLEELKKMLLRIKNTEVQAEALISKFEKK